MRRSTCSGTVQLDVRRPTDRGELQRVRQAGCVMSYFAPVDCVAATRRRRRSKQTTSASAPSGSGDSAAQHDRRVAPRGGERVARARCSRRSWPSTVCGQAVEQVLTLLPRSWRRRVWRSTSTGPHAITAAGQRATASMATPPHRTSADEGAMAATSEVLRCARPGRSACG